MANDSHDTATNMSSRHHDSHFAKTSLLPTSKSQLYTSRGGALQLNHRYTLKWNAKQWILEKKFGNKLASYCVTKKALIRCLGSDYPHGIRLNALSTLESLPETIFEWLEIISSPIGEEEMI